MERRIFQGKWHTIFVYRWKRKAEQKKTGDKRQISYQSLNVCGIRSLFCRSGKPPHPAREEAFFAKGFRATASFFPGSYLLFIPDPSGPLEEGEQLSSFDRVTSSSHLTQSIDSFSPFSARYVACRTEKKAMRKRGGKSARKEDEVEGKVRLLTNQLIGAEHVQSV